MEQLVTGKTADAPEVGMNVTISWSIDEDKHAHFPSHTTETVQGAKEILVNVSKTIH